MISLLIVNYHSAALAEAAVRTARESAGAPLQVVIVDNSCNEAEAEQLRAIADVVIVSETNRGYAGGINLGRRACTGETIVVSNPDVTFAPASIERLGDALDGDTAVAGPALYWDDAHEWILPPADVHSGLEKLDEVLATRSRAWFEQRDRRRIRKRIAFWSLDRITEVPALSGAVMAIRAGDFDAVGGFDERFRLYFEETDFLRRIRERRRRVMYVPDARCRHLYNQSAGQDSSAASAAYAESELRYLEKWNGPFAARLLKRLERPPRAPQMPVVDGPVELDREDLIVEVSPLPTFATAAGHFSRRGKVNLPPEVWATVKSDMLHFRALDRSGVVVSAWQIWQNAISR